MSIYPESIIQTPLGEIKLNFINGEYITAVIEGLEFKKNFYHGHIYTSYLNGKFVTDGKFTEAVRLHRTDRKNVSDAAQKNISETVLEFINNFTVSAEGRKMLKVASILLKLETATNQAKKVQEARKTVQEAENLFNKLYEDITPEDRQFVAENRIEFTKPSFNDLLNQKKA